MKKLGRAAATVLALLLAGACGGSSASSSSNKDAGTGDTGGSSSCQTSLDCAKGRVCDKTSGQCVECVADTDCASGDKCIGNACRPPCTSDRDCTPFGLLCNKSVGFCAQCIQQSDCASNQACVSGVCKSQVCQPGQSICQGNGISTCNADGSSLSAPVACGGNKVCAETAGGPKCEEPDAGAGGLGGMGGIAGTGGSGAAGGGGAGGGGAGGAPDAGRTCVGDLSGTGTGDFRISFTVTTNGGSSAMALLNQRSVCGTSMFWDIRMRATGNLNVETSDGTSSAQFFGTVTINDGVPHHVVVTRKSNLLSATVDGVNSGSTSSFSDLGALPALQQRTDVCVGVDGTAALVGSLSGVCLEKLGP